MEAIISLPLFPEVSMVESGNKKFTGGRKYIENDEQIRLRYSLKRVGRPRWGERCGQHFLYFFTVKLISAISYCVYLIKMFWSSRMKTRVCIQQMKVKNLPSHIKMEVTAQKQDSFLKTYGFPYHQHLQAWEG